MQSIPTFLPNKLEKHPSNTLVLLCDGAAAFEDGAASFALLRVVGIVAAQY